MLTVSELYTYPVKSLGGISLQSATLTDRGFTYDRRWMLVDGDNRFLSQREFASLAMVQVEIREQGLAFHHTRFPGSSSVIPLKPECDEFEMVQIWSDRCKALPVSKFADEWFSDMLSFQCRLMYMPDSSRRRVDGRYARDGEINNLSDALPVLMIGQASLDNLNARMEISLPMNRFRPNIVFTNGTAFEEDTLEHFRIRSIDFFGVKLCGRCNVTTIDQLTADIGKEPLATLATFRRKNNNVYFGQYLLHKGEGSIGIGDLIEVVNKKPATIKLSEL